jgi:glutathione S-transferase
MHCIPTLNDNGYVLWESRAILVYLVEKYGKSDDAWYPKCPKKRGLINQRLYFDMGTLYQRFGDYYYPKMFEGKEYDPQKLVKFEEALGFLNTFLGQSTYAAGEHITIADLALVATISSIQLGVGFDLSKYEDIVRWYELCKKEISGYNELNHEGALQLKEWFGKLL